MPTLQDITDRIRAAVGNHSGLGKTLKLDLKGQGCVFIDGAAVSNENLPADLTITISPDNLLALAAGRLEPAYAIMVGKMQCSDLGLLMGLEEPLKELIARIP
jgi:putative sterol carrier protein